MFVFLAHSSNVSQKINISRNVKFSFSLGRITQPHREAAGPHATIGAPTSLVGGTGQPHPPRCKGGPRVWKPTCNAFAPSPVRMHHISHHQQILCLYIMQRTFVGLASNIICVMEAGGKMGLNGASSVADGGCSLTFIDWWDIKEWDRALDLFSKLEWSFSPQMKLLYLGNSSLQLHIVNR